MSDLKTTIIELAKQARKTSYDVMSLSTEVKNSVLMDIADGLLRDSARILAANHLDLEAARKNGQKAALVERLALDQKGIDRMASAVSEIAALEDPVGRSTWASRRPNGLEIARVRVPIGVIAMIYESRPNVTIDSFALSFKAGNTVILRGGSESSNSNMALMNVITAGLRKNGVPECAAQYVTVTDHAAVTELVKLSDYIDLVIPRGGENLIRAVTEESRVPVIKHYKGVCHVYVDASADLAMATKIVLNAKCQRPGVCNAAETILIHADFHGKKRVIDQMIGAGIEVRADKELKSLNGSCKTAIEEDWYTEYLDLIISAREVASLDDAIAHINKYGSHHSDAIVTSDYASAQRFLDRVDSAAVYVNASTRFTDGAEFGFGAEIGISTDKIHSRGPMGLEDLTSYKYEVRGNGQIRD